MKTKNFVFLPLIFMAVSILFTSCSVNPSKVDADYAKKFIKEATIVKDERTGLCYAVVGTRMTANFSQNGISWTWVPCDQVKQFIDK